MSKVMWKSWQEETIKKISRAAEEAETRGEEKGQLRASRALLRGLLEDQFGPLPEAVVQRIEASNNLEQLKAAAIQAPKLKELDELQL